MTYFPNIPQAADNPSDSQSEIESNFSVIDTTFSVNHEAITDPVIRGRHTFLDLKDLSPDPVPNATYGQLWVRNDAGTENLYFQNQLAVPYHSF